jgi:hypothetical protein
VLRKVWVWELAKVGGATSGVREGKSRVEG